MSNRRQFLEIDELLDRRFSNYRHEYSERDIILYALGVGCTVNQLQYVYENHQHFAALPTFAVIPAHPSTRQVPLEHYLPNFDRVRQQLCSAAWHATAWSNLCGPPNASD